MKPYRDAFGNPLSKKDVTLVANVVTQHQYITVMGLQRDTQLGVAKCERILRLLQDAKVITAGSKNGRAVILKDPAQATNAALRQLKKGWR